MEKDKLIEYMRKAVACHNENPTDCLSRNCCDCPHDYSMEAIKLIESALKLLDGEEKDRWIPVTERLPEIGEYVLCQLPHVQSFGGGKIQVCKYCAPDKYRDKPYFDHFRDGFPNVLAWRPLPKPYTEEKHDKF